MIAEMNKIAHILNISFLLSYIFNNTNKPKPALVINPAVNAPKDMIPSVNSCANITLAAQFGIKPTIAATIGCKKDPSTNNAFSVQQSE